ncbi:C-factor-like [Bombina bombina]|uniref:C-factor-like n=1 Tax=Bombina bombina TaxID=8345 RepID=UPI00235ACEDB|nr:C-factor-like [Bombina bombina]
MAPARILITGCNRGLGLEFVRQLLELPNPPKQIFATCRDPTSPQNKKLNDLAASHPSVVVIKLEATDPASVKEASKEVESHLRGSGLNVVINNAGIMPESTLESADAEDFLHVYNTNVVGPLLVAKALLPFLKKAAEENPKGPLSSNKAALINMSTLLGSIEKTPETFFYYPVLSYRCSKAALNMMTHCQSLGYKKDGILCTAFHPGWVQTDLGGANAPLTADQSVKGMIKVLSCLSEKHNGLLLDWEGNVVPW